MFHCFFFAQGREYTEEQLRGICASVLRGEHCHVTTPQRDITLLVHQDPKGQNYRTFLFKFKHGAWLYFPSPCIIPICFLFTKSSIDVSISLFS